MEILKISNARNNIVDKQIRINRFLRENIIVVVAIMAAIISSIFVSPDMEYLNYIDFRTLSTLFCMLAIVSCYSEIHFFEVAASRIVVVFKNTRSVILALVYITFIGSMIIANDMALITFLPLGYYVLKSTDKENYMAFTFVMQNIAANLGGMLTPFGNPQNLYMYSYYNIGSIEFMEIMLLPFIVSILLITLACLFVRPDTLYVRSNQDKKIDHLKLHVNNALFIIFLCVIFRVLPYQYGVLAVLITLYFIDRNALRKTDYGLLLTFTAFFIFSGNVSRIGFVSELFSKMLEINTLFTGIVSCQLISNVPSAILLSKFTANYKDLLVAVNLGGTGTLIASLASLITYREYVKHNPDKKAYYLKVFSAINFGFLGAILSILLLIN